MPVLLRPLLMALLGAMAALPLAARAAAPPAPASDVTDAADGWRIIRHFDFEEAELAPIAFPSFFKRNIAEDRGFRRFGRLAPSDTAAASGRWSFRFDLDGGSLSAGTPTGVIPILPLADYGVSVQVRTSGLTHARARLVAWLTDTHGQLVPGSRVESPAVATDGRWEMLSVHLTGAHEAAVDLIVGLELVQPDQLGAAAGADEPLFQDVRGTAWFDDVVIRHLPRIELRTTAPANVMSPGAPPRLTLLVRDLANEALTARVLVHDYEGTIAFDTALRAPRGRHPATIELPIRRSGWYRANVTLADATNIVGAASLDFVILPDAPAVHGASSLGVRLPATPEPSLAATAVLVRSLGVGEVVVPVWPSDGVTGTAPQRRVLIDALLAADLDVTFALEAIPADLARALGMDGREMLELLAGDETAWRSRLEDLLISFGLRVPHWQIGPVEPRGLPADRRDELAAQAATVLARFVPELRAIIPIAADETVPAPSPNRGTHITIPYHIRPDVLLDATAAWGAPRDDLHVTFDLLPEEYAPRQQMLDLALRTLHGWRGGLEHMAIAAPWIWQPEAAGAAVPRPAFPAWRGLADALRGRRFAGELFIDDRIHCWLMEAEDPRRHALVAWRDQRRTDPAVEARLALGPRLVTVVDLFGNARTLAAEDDVHALEITDTPMIVEGIDLDLARFRRSIALAPSVIPAAHRVHEQELVLHNPWPTGLSGTIRLEDDSDCVISPRVQEFEIPAGETLRLPAESRCGRNVVSGPKRVVAHVRLEADRLRDIRVPLNIEVQWEQVSLNATWHVGRDAATGARDLIVTQIVTNRGDEVLHLDGFVRAPGMPQNRRSITGLQPGATATKTYRIPDGASRLAGRAVHLGVTEREGASQLTRRLDIPALLADAPRTVDATTE